MRKVVSRTLWVLFRGGRLKQTVFNNAFTLLPIGVRTSISGEHDEHNRVRVKGPR